MIVGHGGGGCGHLGGNFLMWWSSSYSAHGDCRVRCAHGLGGDRGRFGGHCMGVGHGTKHVNFCYVLARICTMRYSPIFSVIPPCNARLKW